MQELLSSIPIMSYFNKYKKVSIFLELILVPREWLIYIQSYYKVIFNLYPTFTFK